MDPGQVQDLAVAAGAEAGQVRVAGLARIREPEEREPARETRRESATRWRPVMERDLLAARALAREPEPAVAALAQELAATCRVGPQEARLPCSR